MSLCSDHHAVHFLTHILFRIQKPYESHVSHIPSPPIVTKERKLKRRSLKKNRLGELVTGPWHLWRARSMEELGKKESERE